MRHKISKRERALLTIAAAQQAAGPGRTPTARQVRKAHDTAGCAVAKRGVVVHGGADVTDHVMNKVCGVLSGIGGETDAECGNFWSRLKNVATQAAPLAPLFGPTAMVAVPVAQKLTNRGSAPTASSDDASVQEVSGFGPERQKVEDYTYIFGDELVLGTDLDELDGDELELEGEGAVEAAAARRFGRGHRRHHAAASGYQPEPELRGMFRAPAPGLPHEAYRVAILRRARRLTGGKQPTAKQMAQAQASVDKDMRMHGLDVAIPGGRPGRVTR
jgi:hypothetical protein